MKLLTIETGEGLKLGVKTEQGVLDVTRALAAVPTNIEVAQSIEEVLQQGQKAVAQLEAFYQEVLEAGLEKQEVFLEESAIKIGPAVPSPGKIICVGLNYTKHAEETNMPIPEYPILFNKFDNTIAADGDEIALPFNSKEVDYEAELVIVIGKTTKRVSKENALDHVFGYCNVNDLSARDLQFRTNQWLLGKCLDGFSPVGPYLVTADEVDDPNNLGIRAYVNGEERQNSNTSDMIFHCDKIVSYISEHMTLQPGDIILTGTPEGVVFGYPKEKQVWLKDGDEVTIEIDKLGRLTNTFKQEK